MEIIKFLKWQWNRLEKSEKCMAVIITVSLIVAAICGYIAAPHLVWPMVAFVGFLFTAFLQFLVYVVYESISSRWKLYKEEQEKEAQKIMDKLRGQQSGDAEQFSQNLYNKLKQQATINPNGRIYPAMPGSLTKKSP
jgi:amino acid permease